MIEGLKRTNQEVTTGLPEEFMGSDDQNGSEPSHLFHRSVIYSVLHMEVKNLVLRLE
jgi:hypothetical protein